MNEKGERRLRFDKIASSFQVDLDQMKLIQKG